LIAFLLWLLSDPSANQKLHNLFPDPTLLPDPSLVNPFIAPWSIAPSIYPWSVPYSLIHPFLPDRSLASWSVTPSIALYLSLLIVPSLL
jgi:hypothetical protein